MGFIGVALESRKRMAYPEMPILQAGVDWYESFNRATLNISGNPTLYTSAATGTGTSTIGFDTADSFAELLTSGSAGDNVDLRTSEFAFQIADKSGTAGTGPLKYLNQLSRVTFKCSFSLGTATAVQMFAGILASNAAITAPPTTARHAGVFLDTGTNANFRLTSANGTTQVNDDSGQAADTSVYLLEIDWTGSNAAAIRFYNSARSLIASQTVTAFTGSTRTPMIVHFFVETTGAATRNLRIYDWGYTTN